VNGPVDATDGVPKLHQRRDTGWIRTPEMPMKCRATRSLIALALLAFRADADGTAWDLEIVPLKPDIYLLQRPEPLRQPVEGNVLVIVNERDVVVFEGGGMPIVQAEADDND
jgi:TPP-dependent trihydroxycyclohexane-1,2-dione (THcHDO) dehydratase